MTLFRMSCLILLGGTLFAQQSTSGAARQPHPQAATTAAPAAGLTANGVVSMVEAGLSDDVIIARLRKESKALDLSADDLIRLKKAKVSDVLLKVMLDPKAEINPPAAAAAPPQQAVESVMMAPAAMPGIGIAKPSGATPSPGNTSGGDPNDPLAPHDSGIYLYTKDRDGKPQMIVLERASYQGSKTGGMLGSSLTYGIVKVKTKAVIPGPHAGIRVMDASPTFYFYFEDKQAGLGKTYFGIGSLSNPNQFALLKLDVTKSNRETVIGKFSAWGSSSGSDAKAMTPFKSERVRPGLYKVTVEGLSQGEYCFLASTGNLGVAGPYGLYGAGGSSADIFDFGVSSQ
jgi:hypothetical protein